MSRIIILLSFILLSWQEVAGQDSKGDAYYRQAKTWLEKGEANKALKALDNAKIEFLKERNWEGYFIVMQSLTIFYQDTGKGAESEKILREAIATIPKSSSENMVQHAKLHDNLGYTYLYSLDNTDKAITEYNESIRLYEAAGDHLTDIAFERVNRAACYHTKGLDAESVTDYRAAITIYEQDPTTDKTTLANVYNSIGHSYRALSQFAEAIINFKKALQVSLDAGEKELQAVNYNDLSIAQEENGDYAEALVNIEKSKSIDAEIFGKDADHYAVGCINAGNIQKSLGDLASALTQYQEALTIFSKTPPSNSQDLIDVMLNVAGVTNEMGLTDQSKLIHAEVLRLVEDQSGANSLNMADIYISMAVAAFHDAEYDQSLNYNFKALDILQAHKFGGTAVYAQLYNNIGLAYDESMELELALQYKNQALELYKKMHGPAHPDVAMAISNIGLTYEMSEEYDKAIEFLTTALNMRIKALGPMHDEVGTNYLNIGLMYLKKLQYDKAILHLEKARAIYDQYAKSEEKAMIYNRLGAAYSVTKDLAKASHCYQKAIISNVINFSDETPDSFPEKPDYLTYYELIIAYTGKADLYLKRDDTPGLLAGIKHLDAADKILKEKAIRLNNPKDRLKLAQLNGFFTESGMNLVYKLVNVTKDPTWLEKAFYFSERNKANELYADIQVSRAGAIAKVPEKILKQQRELANQFQSVDQQLAQAYTAKNQALITRFKAQLFDLDQENKRIEEELIKSAPSYLKQTGQRDLPTWSQVKTQLGPNTALVSYTITDSAKFILIGTPGKLLLQYMDPGIDLEKLIRGFRNQIKFQAAELATSTQQLTDAIWKPVEAALSQMGTIQNIIILPDGPLSLLPFEALQENGKFLVEKYTIRYHLSGAMMAQSPKGTPQKKPSLIALAPVFADEETNFVNKSCERFAGAANKADSVSRAFTLDGDYIMPLPGTELEVQEIHKSVSGNDQLSKYFLKKDANEALIKKGELSKYDYVHFATHGIVNAQYPELSGLLLAQDRESSEDGILYTGEIFGLNLKAELVTLSACETALGKRVEGEGVRGLTSAFLFAGAHTVVVSLWKVADASTAQLMINFYDQLLTGKDKANSLRHAKLSLLKDSKYSHPFYWAPFVQVGSN